MPQTLRTTNDIINNAFYMLGEFTPNKIPEARDITTGLYILNDMFDYYSSRGVYIPFFNTVSFTMVPNQGTYTFSNVITNPDVTSERIVEIDFINVIQDEVSYPVTILPQSQFKNMTRWTNLAAWPDTVYLQREVYVSKLVFYPLPQLPFVCEVVGKFMLDHLELHDQLSEIPPYYYRFLRYALARELKEFYPSSNWSETSENEYKIMFESLVSATDLDVSLNDSNILLNSQYDYSVYRNGVWG